MGQVLRSDVTQVKNFFLLRAGFRNPPSWTQTSLSGCQLLTILKQERFLLSVPKGWLVGWLVEHELVAKGILKFSWTVCLEGSSLLRGTKGDFGHLTGQLMGTP